MANEISSGQLITASKINDITVGTPAPASPTAGQIWVDTSTNPPTVRVRTQSNTWAALTPSVTSWKLIYSTTSGSAVTTLNDTNYAMASFSPSDTMTFGSSRFILRLIASWGTSGTSRAMRLGFTITLQNGYAIAILGLNPTLNTSSGVAYVELVHMPHSQGSFRAGGFFYRYNVSEAVQPLFQQAITGPFSTSSPITGINFVANATASTGETVTLNSASVELFTTL